jgi:hypothetical protein
MGNWFSAVPLAAVGVEDGSMVGVALSVRLMVIGDFASSSSLAVLVRELSLLLVRDADCVRVDRSLLGSAVLDGRSDTVASLVLSCRM